MRTATRLRRIAQRRNPGLNRVRAPLGGLQRLELQFAQAIVLRPGYPRPPWRAPAGVHRRAEGPLFEKPSLYAFTTATFGVSKPMVETYATCRPTFGLFMVVWCRALVLVGGGTRSTTIASAQQSLSTHRSTFLTHVNAACDQCFSTFNHAIFSVRGADSSTNWVGGAGCGRSRRPTAATDAAR